MKSAAIVTLAIGEKYEWAWKTYCAPSWQLYADKHQFDVIPIVHPLDHSERAASRGVAWQKCLVLSQDFAQKYSQIVLLDSDIVINSLRAPSIVEQVPPERVGGVMSGSHIHEDLRAVLLRRLRGVEPPYQRGFDCWSNDQRQFYRLHGLSELAGIVQAGVLVASPRHHRKLFEDVYHEPCGETRSYEQIPLSHALQTSGVFQPIDTRFNSVFFETMQVHYPYLLDRDNPNFALLAQLATRVEYFNSFFLHFAYEIAFMPYLFDPPPQTDS
jgi:hypothetical protein